MSKRQDAGIGFERLAWSSAIVVAAIAGKGVGLHQASQTAYDNGYMNGTADALRTQPVVMQTPDGTTIVGEVKP